MSSTMIFTPFKRSDSSDTSFSANGTIIQLLTALVVLAGLGMVLTGILFTLRQMRKKRNGTPMLPTHTRNHSLSVTTIPYRVKRTSFFGSLEKKSFDSTPSTPTSPVPEIRITFPEEEGADGKRKSGRVVIVQVGEAGAAFVRDVEPDNLPPYQKKGQFEAVDLEKVGGLKEKENWA